MSSAIFPLWSEVGYVKAEATTNNRLPKKKHTLIKVHRLYIYTHTHIPDILIGCAYLPIFRKLIINPLDKSIS